MVAPQVTWRQKLLASDWLPRLWTLGVSVAVTGWTLLEIDPGSEVWSDLAATARVLLSCAIAFLLGSIASVPVGWVLFGPLLMAQGEENGGPFQPGDHVRIIAGPFRGRVAQVYSSWQHETVRVDLGDEPRRKYQDIFAAYQLLRVEMN